MQASPRALHGLADRAVQHGFQALVVLGGDKSVGPPRCGARVQLREEIRRHQPQLLLGGWANPHGNTAQQVAHLLDEHATAEFYLTEIVSHHSREHVREFVSEAERCGLAIPGIRRLLLSFGQSTDARSPESFLPVPAAKLTAEFGAGATADEICARTIRRCERPGPVTSTSATCSRSARRER